MIDTHISFDLETFGTATRSIVVSIGAVRFQIGETENKIIDEFKINIDPVDAKKYGLKASADTLEWWSKQSPEARAGWKHDPKPLAEAMRALREWHGFKRQYVWGFGANFDIVLLDDCFQALGEKEPWKYTDIMCLRTVSNLMGERVPRMEGTHHDSLDDARNQARFIMDKIYGK